ncbi:MAG: PEGA domain-containing protein [Deltaproteobacteria bacterium]
MQRVGRYHVFEELRQTEVARMFRAYEVAGGVVRDVELLRGLGRDAESSLVEGATIAAHIDHHVVARVVDIDQDADGVYVVQTAIAGRPLSVLMEKSRASGVAIDPSAATFIAMELLAGLEAVHQARTPEGGPLRVVHCDVNADAVVIGHDGRVRLSNFFYAQSSTRPAPPVSPRTIAPELNGGIVDARTDVYAVARLVWTMLAGREPDPNRAEPLVQAAPHVPPALAMTIDRALLADPNQRHASAAVFRDELARILYGGDPTYSSTRLATLLAMVLGSEAGVDRQADTAARRELSGTGGPPVDTMMRPAGFVDASSSRPAPTHPEPVAADEPIVAAMYGGPPTDMPAPMYGGPPADTSLPRMSPAQARAQTAQVGSPPPLDDRSLPLGKIVISAVAALVIAMAVFTLWSDRNQRLVTRKLREAFVGRNAGGTITIESIPPGALVTLDDEETGKRTPLTIENLESVVTHYIELNIEGETPVTSTVAIKAGAKRTMNLVFPGAVVNLAVKSEPVGAELWMDGNNVALTPATMSVRTNKETKIAVKKLGYVPFEQTLTPERGKPIDLDITLEKTPELIAQEALEAEAMKAMEEEAKPKKRRRRRRR